MPSVQLFSDVPDWKLESPDAPSESPLMGEIAPPSTESATDYQLNGMLIISNTAQPRDWVREEFLGMNEINRTRSSPFPPNIYRFFTNHIILRLIDLHQAGRYCELSSGKDLEKFLREDVEMGFIKKELGKNASGDGKGEVLVIQSGRLRPITYWGKSVGTILATILAVVLPFVLIELIQPREAPSPKPTTEVLTTLDVILKNPWGNRARSSRAGPDSSNESPSGEVSRGGDNAISEPADGPSRDTLSNHEVPPRTADASQPLSVRHLLQLVMILVLLAVVPLIAIAVDTLYLTLPISPSILPDGQSILPTLYLYQVVGILALYLPFHFKEDIHGRGRPRPQTAGTGDNLQFLGLLRWSPPLEKEREERFNDFIKRWIQEDVNPNLRCDSRENLFALLAAGFLTILDYSAGIPIAGSPGWTKVIFLIYEFVVLYLVICTGIIFIDMARAVVFLKRRLQSLEARGRRE